MRLLEFKLVEQLPELFAVFGSSNALGRRAENRNSGLEQAVRQVQRGLPAHLDDHTDRLFGFVNVHHIFEGERLEVKFVGGIVVGRNGLRV